MSDVAAEGKKAHQKGKGDGEAKGCEKKGGGQGVQRPPVAWNEMVDYFNEDKGEDERGRERSQETDGVGRRAEARERVAEVEGERESEKEKHGGEEEAEASPDEREWGVDVRENRGDEKDGRGEKKFVQRGADGEEGERIEWDESEEAENDVFPEARPHRLQFGSELFKRRQRSFADAVPRDGEGL